MPNYEIRDEYGMLICRISAKNALEADEKAQSTHAHELQKTDGYSINEYNAQEGR